jgi:hypothetical protein
MRVNSLSHVSNFDIYRKPKYHLYIKTHDTEVYRGVTDEQHNTTTQKPKRDLSKLYTGLRNLPQQRTKQHKPTAEKSLALNLNVDQILDAAHMLI